MISAGAVGLALAQACQRAGFELVGVVAPSRRSQEHAAARLPGVPVVDLELAAQAALVLLAVPDPQLPGVIERVAEVTRAGQIVAHTSGQHGCRVLQPVTDTGALPLALHPAMAFTGSEEDSQNLIGCGWGVTADSAEGRAVAQLLVEAWEGQPVDVPEASRSAYHAAMAHAGNHLVTVVADALEMLDAALASASGPEPAGTGPGGLPAAGIRPAAAHPTPGVGDPTTSSPGGARPPSVDPRSAVLLRRILAAATTNALDARMSALTGPIARDDAPTVQRHLDALGALGVGQDAYAELARRTARRRHAIDVERLFEGLR